MTVETRIAEMSDSGKFESIATSIIRRADSYYESVIQTGVNAEGKPIQDPVDGFAWVRGPKHKQYIFFEYTTTKKKDLESKWLADPDPDSSQEKGDVIKAAELADEIRSDAPDAEFKVVLVSNKEVGSGLAIKAESEAEDRGLKTDIWGVHRLGDFLKNNPDGQWIRQNSLGIEAERLSKPLLLEIGEKSLEAYQEEFRVEVEDLRIQRPELSTLLDAARGAGSSGYLIPIIGNSGFGKTVTSYQALEEWLDSEKPVLRLTSNDVEASASLSQALQSALQRHHESLTASAGQDAIRLAKESDRLLVVVDDLNRAHDPSHLFKRISNWGGDLPEDDEDEVEEFPVVILCPLWPRVWTRQKRNVRYNKFAEPLELGPFSPDTAKRLIQAQADMVGVDIAESDARDLAENVGGDPHIIGLLGQLIEKEGGVENLPEASKEVIREFVDYSYETAGSDSEASLVAADYGLAVDRLSHNVLREKKLDPAWRTVRDWISRSEDLTALRELTKQAQLLFLIQKQGDQSLLYRHDRLRDYLLSDFSLSKIEKDGAHIGYLGDPYYHSILGKGIAYFRPPEAVLSRLCEENALALFEALREIGGEAPEYEETLRTVIQTWLDEHGGPDNLSPLFLGKAGELLQETDSTAVLNLTESFPAWPQVLLARFRNGDLKAGIQFCSQGRSGSPNTNFPQRDSIIDRVKVQWVDQYAEALADWLSSTGEEHVGGSLQLAGFVGSSEIVPGIEGAWEVFGEEERLLAPFIWAAFQCGIPNHTTFVDKTFERWSSLPSASAVDDENNSSSSSGDPVTKGDVFTRFKFALTRDPSQEQIQYLIDAVDRFPDLEYHLVLLLQRVSDPDALELVVRTLGQYKREAKGHGPIHLSSNLSRRWDPDTRRGQTLPPQCKARLHEIWSTETEHDEVRRLAFRTWTGSAEDSELDTLREASNIELFEYRAYSTRLELGDESVYRSDAFDIVETPAYLQSVSKAWCADAYDMVDDILTSESRSDTGDLFYQLAQLMFRIPDKDAEHLLDTHWERIGDDPSFFQAALYTATPLTRVLAEEKYSESDNPGQLLGHIGMSFGFNTYGRSELISKDQLVSIEPYLSDIDQMTLVEIAKKAKELGLTGWSADNIQPLLSDEHRYQGHPTDDDLFERLDEIKHSDDPTVEVRLWMDEFERRAESKSRAFRILDEWFEENSSVDSYKVVAEAVKRRGTREHLSILENTTIEDEDGIRRMFSETKFGVEVRTLK